MKMSATRKSHRSYLILAAALCWTFSTCSDAGQKTGQAAHGSVDLAFDQRVSNIPVEDEGTISRILADDTSGSPHQRLIVRLVSGRTVLIQHNIEVAPRVDGVGVGDKLGFSGEYIWNDQGGLVHWTHHAPAGRHAAGWLAHNGRVYQ